MELRGSNGERKVFEHNTDTEKIIPIDSGYFTTKKWGTIKLPQTRIPRH